MIGLIWGPEAAGGDPDGQLGAPLKCATSFDVACPT